MTRPCRFFSFKLIVEAHLCVCAATQSAWDGRPLYAPNTAQYTMILYQKNHHMFLRLQDVHIFILFSHMPRNFQLDITKCIHCIYQNLIVTSSIKWPSYIHIMDAQSELQQILIYYRKVLLKRVQHSEFIMNHLGFTNIY